MRLTNFEGGGVLQTSERNARGPARANKEQGLVGLSIQLQSPTQPIARRGAALSGDGEAERARQRSCVETMGVCFVAAEAGNERLGARGMLVLLGMQQRRMLQGGGPDGVVEERRRGGEAVQASVSGSGRTGWRRRVVKKGGLGSSTAEARGRRLARGRERRAPGRGSCRGGRPWVVVVVEDGDGGGGEVEWTSGLRLTLTLTLTQGAPSSGEGERRGPSAGRVAPGRAAGGRGFGGCRAGAGGARGECNFAAAGLLAGDGAFHGQGGWTAGYEQVLYTDTTEKGSCSHCARTRADSHSRCHATPTTAADAAATASSPQALTLPPLITLQYRPPVLAG